MKISVENPKSFLVKMQRASGKFLKVKSRYVLSSGKRRYVLSSSPPWHKGVSQFLREPCFSYQSMHSGAHARIEIRPSARRATIYRHEPQAGDEINWKPLGELEERGREKYFDEREISRVPGTTLKRAGKNMAQKVSPGWEESAPMKNPPNSWAAAAAWRV